MILPGRRSALSRRSRSCARVSAGFDAEERINDTIVQRIRKRGNEDAKSCELTWCTPNPVPVSFDDPRNRPLNRANRRSVAIAKGQAAERRRLESDSMSVHRDRSRTAA